MEDRKKNGKPRSPNTWIGGGKKARNWKKTKKFLNETKPKLDQNLGAHVRLLWRLTHNTSQL